MKALFTALFLLSASVSLRAESPAPLHLTLPPLWHAVEGVPLSLYFDNIVLAQDPQKYQFEVISDVGVSEATRWTVTPARKDAGDHRVEVVVKDQQGAVLERAATTLRISPSDAGSGRSLRLLIIGDSLTAATHYPNEVARLLSTPGNPVWKMYGSNSPSHASPGVAHEGYGGWTWESFMSRYEPKPVRKEDGKGWKKFGSPFLVMGKDGKPLVDVAHYLKTYCQGETPQVVTFLLGINDCFTADPNDATGLEARIDVVLGNAEKLLACFRAALPDTTFAVGLTTPPNSRQAAFQANYKDKYTRWGWKRIQHRLVQKMIERFGERQQDRLYLVATELNLDPEAGYPADNAVHPNPTGYAQIGTSFYGWIKAWLDGKP